MNCETKERSTFFVVLFDTSKPMINSNVACLYPSSPEWVPSTFPPDDTTRILKDGKHKLVRNRRAVDQDDLLLTKLLRSSNLTKSKQIRQLFYFRNTLTNFFVLGRQIRKRLHVLFWRAKTGDKFLIGLCDFKL